MLALVKLSVVKPGCSHLSTGKDDRVIRLTFDMIVIAKFHQYIAMSTNFYGKQKHIYE